MKSSRNSLFLMMFPVLALLAFGWWRQRNPPKPPLAPPKFGFTVKVTKEPIYPVDVWAGRDTKVRIAAKTIGTLPPAWRAPSVEWLQCLRLVARKNKRDRTLFCRGTFDNYESYVRWLPARGGGSGSGGSAGDDHSLNNISFALRNVPQDLGELWLLLDMGIRPATSIDQKDIDEATLAKLKEKGGVIWASKSLLLRRDNETIKMPIVSTNPQFRIDKWSIEPFKAAPGNPYEDKELVIHLFDTGSQSQEQDLWSPVKAGSDWQIVDEKGQPRSRRSGDPAAITQSAEDKRRYTAKLQFSSRFAPEAQKLRLHGQLSCNNRWPLMIDIPLIDRTEKTSAKALAR